ncbi:MAG: 50S ribosomal protein L20 [Candidatus Omnitrophota bacterium]
MRTTHSVAAKKRKKKILALAKGFWGQRSRTYRRAKESVRRALAYAYRDRRAKKRDFRSLWIIRINAAARANGMPYRHFIAGLKKKQIMLSRDILADIASEEPAVFEQIVELVKQ